MFDLLGDVLKPPDGDRECAGLGVSALAEVGTARHWHRVIDSTLAIRLRLLQACGSDDRPSCPEGKTHRKLPHG